MNATEKLREFMVDSLEAFAQERITELYDEGKSMDAHALYLEYVVDDQNPEQWTFIDIMIPGDCEE
jgi:hypothetical protein